MQFAPLPLLSVSPEEARPQPESAASPAPSAVAASASSSSSPGRALQSLAVSLFTDARRLLAEALPLAESMLQRFKSQRLRPLEALFKRAERELLVLLSLEDLVPADAARVEHLQRKLARLFPRIEEGKGLYSNSLTESRRSIASHSRTAVCTSDLTNLAMMLLTFRRIRLALASPPAEDEQQHEAIRQWILRIDALCTQFTEAVPHLRMTLSECNRVLQAAMLAGALPLVSALLHEAHDRRAFTLDFGSTLAVLASRPNPYEVSLQPYLRLLESGLDPAAVGSTVGHRSALDSARKFIREQRMQVSAAAVQPAAMALRKRSNWSLSPRLKQLRRLQQWSSRSQRSLRPRSSRVCCRCGRRIEPIRSRRMKSDDGLLCMHNSRTRSSPSGALTPRRCALCCLRLLPIV